MTAEDDRRVHDALRTMVDRACEGILPCIADKIRDATRRAYYLGCADGMRFAQESEEEQVEGMRHNHEG